MLSNKWLIFLAFIIFIFAIHIGTGTMLNFKQPSVQEHNLGINLANHISQNLAQGSEKVLFDASANIVNINIYGLINVEGQDKLIGIAKKYLASENYFGEVRINFFPLRIEKETKDSNGITFKSVIKTEIIRTYTFSKKQIKPLKAN